MYTVRVRVRVSAVYCSIVSEAPKLELVSSNDRSVSAMHLLIGLPQQQLALALAHRRQA